MIFFIEKKKSSYLELCFCLRYIYKNNAHTHTQWTIEKTHMFEKSHRFG